MSPDQGCDGRRGLLAFRGEPLDLLVEELNLPLAQPLRGAVPQLPTRPISGVLRLEDEPSAMRRPALLTPRTVVERDGATVLEPASDGAR